MHINTIGFPVFLSASAGHRTFPPVFFPPFEGAFATFYLDLTSFITFQFCSIFNRTNNGLVRGLQPDKASCPKLHIQYDASPPLVAFLFTVENISSFLSPKTKLAHKRAEIKKHERLVRLQSSPTLSFKRS